MFGKYKLTGLWLILIVGSTPLPAAPAGADKAEFTRLYESFQTRYWHANATIHGIETSVFDYAAMARDSRDEDSLYAGINRTLLSIDPHMPADETSKAFWLNAYNFAAMKLIIENYPVNSIRAFKISILKHPWSKKAIQVGDQSYSLEQIEKEILLRQFNDPRIVFAVSCAAVSCPDRTPAPFRAADLDRQLDDIIHRFFENRTKGLLVDTKNNRVILSWILEKDRHLFGGTDTELKQFVCGYVTRSICDTISVESMEIRYFKHDWTLNDLALANAPDKQ